MQRTLNPKPETLLGICNLLGGGGWGGEGQEYNHGAGFCSLDIMKLSDPVADRCTRPRSNLGIKRVPVLFKKGGVVRKTQTLKHGNKGLLWVSFKHWQEPCGMSV